MTTHLDSIHLPAMTVRDVCKAVIEMNADYIRLASKATAGVELKTFLQPDVSVKAEDIITVAREMGLLPPAYDPLGLGLIKSEAEAEEYRAWRAERDAAKVDKPIERESCPECSNGKLHVQNGGGVKCDKCNYWFCY